MNTQPTEAALLRAARAILGDMPHIKRLDPKIRKQVIAHAAERIGKETGLPELIASCIKLLECADDVLGCFQQGVYNDHGLEELRQDVKAAQVALAKAKGEA